MFVPCKEVSHAHPRRSSPATSPGRSLQLVRLIQSARARCQTQANAASSLHNTVDDHAAALLSLYHRLMCLIFEIDHDGALNW
jgi:hypothetical protein